MLSHTLSEIKSYLQTIKPAFINGMIRLVSEDGVIKITYKDSFLDFTVKEKVKSNDKEALYQIVDFCFSVYCDYERDWTTKNSEFLAKLLNISHGNMRIILHRILEKLKAYGEPVLREEEKVSNVQNHWQESEWSMIPEKHGTKFPWSEKERFEVPLWENSLDYSQVKTDVNNN